jgi:hypothetical protein
MGAKCTVDPSNTVEHSARSAARAAWDRVERDLPGDFDRDGK